MADEENPIPDAPALPEGAEATSEAATDADDGAATVPAAAHEAAPADVLAAVEAMLYASGKPVSVERLAEAAELPPGAVEAALARIEEACAEAGRGVKLDRVAGGVRLVSRPEHDFAVRRLLGLDGRTKLSMAALETLAIVAYRQPITGPEIAEMRGVNSSSSIRTLLDRKLITTAGRKEVVGTPFLYKTTREFLVRFGLNAVGELPRPEELEAIYGQEAPAAPEPSQTELFPSEETGEPAGTPEEPAPPADAEPVGE